MDDTENEIDETHYQQRKRIVNKSRREKDTNEEHVEYSVQIDAMINEQRIATDRQKHKGDSHNEHLRD